MKCVILLSLLALCYSVPVTTQLYNVTVDNDGTITITASSGKKMVICCEKGDLIKFIIEGPLEPTRTILINDSQQRSRNLDLLDQVMSGLDQSEESSEEKRELAQQIMKESPRVQSQFDILTKIFGEHQGVRGFVGFQKLLRLVRQHVQSGELNPAIYKILQSFGEELSQDQSTSSEEVNLLGPEQGTSQKIAFLRHLLNEMTGQAEEQTARSGGLRQALFQRNPQVNIILFKDTPVAIQRGISQPQLQEELFQEMRNCLGRKVQIISLDELQHKPLLQQFLRRHLTGIQSQQRQDWSLPQSQDWSLPQSQEQMTRQFLQRNKKDMLQDKVQQMMQDKMTQELMEEKMQEAMQETVEELMKEKMQQKLQQKMQEKMQEKMQGKTQRKLKERIQDKLQEMLNEMDEQSGHEMTQDEIQEKVEDLIQDEMQGIMQDKMQDMMQDKMQEMMQDKMQEMMTRGRMQAMMDEDEPWPRSVYPWETFYQRM